jgi:hypothetical protein
MSPRKPPAIESRREEAFFAEMQQRALAWIPEWGNNDGQDDFGQAILHVAARYSSEVAERLDRAGEKMRLGLLDWLGVRGKAAIPSRVPVVFQLVEGTRDSVLAQAPVLLQADTQGATVMFETESTLTISPARIASLVASRGDAICLPPPGLSSLAPKEAKPTRWKLKSSAAAGSTILQVTPDLGLEPGQLLRIGSSEHDVVSVDGDLVTIKPPLDATVAEATVAVPTDITLIEGFTPFESTRNWQEHALYLGDDELFHIESEATIDISVDPKRMPNGVIWQYWGKQGNEEKIDWQPLEVKSESSATTQLQKPKGSIEETLIKGRKARWIRAIAGSSTHAVRLANVSVKINPPKKPDATNPKTSATSETQTAEAHEGNANPSSIVRAEGMSNTTPLVLENTFYPLGKEPKQFDAFYLGCQEAFSKKRAEIQMYFAMNDRTQMEIATVPSNQRGNRLVGIGQDKKFYEYQLLDTSSKIQCTVDGLPLERIDESNNKIPVAIDEPRWRLPVSSPDSQMNYSVLVTAKDEVWEVSLPAETSKNLGKIPRTSSVPRIDSVVVTRDNRIHALVEEKVYEFHRSDNSWVSVPGATDIATICSVDSFVPATIDLPYSLSVTTEGNLSFMIEDAGDIDGLDKKLSWATQPIALTIAPNRILVIALSQKNDLLRIILEKDGSVWKAESEVVFSFNLPPKRFAWNSDESSARIITTLARTSEGNAPQSFFVISLNRDGNPTNEFETSLTPGNSQSNGIIVGEKLIAAGPTGQFYIGDFTIKSFHDEVPKSTFARGFSANGIPDDVVKVWTSPTNELNIHGKYSGDFAGPLFFETDESVPKSADKVYFFPSANKRVGVVGDDNKSISVVSVVEKNTRLLVNEKVVKVQNIVEQDGKRWARFSNELPGPLPAPTLATREIEYYFENEADIVPLTYFRSNEPTWAQSWASSADVEIRSRISKVLFAKITDVGAPATVWIDTSDLPLNRPSIVPITVRRSTNRWSHFLPNDSTNPELSWEYWNGTGWWHLPIKSDETRNLKLTGNIFFDAPPDINLSDWSGKTNYWIRARLIGGDYGKETVTIEQVPDGVAVKQTITRSFTGVPPTVANLSVSYVLSKSVSPKHLITEDSQSFRDQSEANRIAGTTVEAFVPLDTELTRLAPPNTSSILSTTRDSRYLFVGIDGPMEGSAFNLLILVDEQPGSDVVSLQVDALVADQFVPMLHADSTRGLSESGIVSIYVSTSPTPAELFGQSLRWLRLSPKDPSHSQWSPKIRGIYINAVWASATETLTRELLGSSDGSPHLQVRLARPPVLHDTLELRIREPLSQNERIDLIQSLPRQPLQSGQPRSAPVLSDVENLPGDWVLWQQVVDPLDESPNARVYSLDEESGVIRFGDGLHGMIPPIGRDSIVAFGYKRTEPPVPTGLNSDQNFAPGNGIEPRKQLNLVSPVSSVESVIAADQSAGGVPAESTARVLQTGYASLRHRQRILTIRDLEERILEFAPEAAQAKAFVSAGHVEVVVVNTGANPQPTAQQIRAWKQRVLECSTPWLSSLQSFQIVGPKVRYLKAELQLLIDSIDSAGTVAESVIQRLTAFFDVAKGGIHRRGWKIGQGVSEQEIALAIQHIPHLESLREIQLLEFVPKKQELPKWNDAVGSKDLVQLAKDFVKLDFLTIDAVRSMSESRSAAGVSS